MQQRSQGFPSSGMQQSQESLEMLSQVFPHLSELINDDDLTSSVLQKVLQSTLLASNQANQAQVMHFPFLNLAESQGQQAEVEDTFAFLVSAKK